MFLLRGLFFEYLQVVVVNLVKPFYSVPLYSGKPFIVEENFFVLGKTFLILRYNPKKLSNLEVPEKITLIILHLILNVITIFFIRMIILMFLMAAGRMITYDRMNQRLYSKINFGFFKASFDIMFLIFAKRINTKIKFSTLKMQCIEIKSQVKSTNRFPIF